MPARKPSADNLGTNVSAAQDWTGRRVTLMGLGRHGGGLGAARYLARHGAHLTVTDAALRESLAPFLAELAQLPIRALRLGEHDVRDFRDAEYIVANPAVRLDHPCLEAARQSGAIVTSEIELLLERCPAHVIGVTGSNGKSTVATMLAEILSTAGRRTWLGGNIGGSLLGELNRMTCDDWVVLELSSFQLAHLSHRARLPEISVVTNCTPNHLDWHASFDEYAAAKQRLLRRPDGLAILNPRDPVVGSWLLSSDGRVCPAWPLASVPPLSVPGDHNRQNAACAAAAAAVAGVEREAIIAALRGFSGLKHRIQLVAEARGRRFYDDSKATSPAATQAALATVEGPLWLLAGGVSKGTAFDGLATSIVQRARGAGLFGAARHELHARVASQSVDFPTALHATLAEALDWCLEQSAPGDAILLSPGCASFDQFRDFAERGTVFRDLARKAA